MSTRGYGARLPARSRFGLAVLSALCCGGANDPLLRRKQTTDADGGMAI
jgi:hypothetical protein